MEREKSSGMIVYRIVDGKREFLLLVRKEGFLDFPKGHIEAGETEETAAIREVREETGLNLEPARGFRYVQEYWYSTRQGRINKEVVMFISRANAGDVVKISHEHIGYKWITYEDCLLQLSFKNQIDMLKTATRKLEEMDATMH
ncbi:dihydroneopterin triphosphate pyrophosphatase [Thermoplasmatales archaeon]|nr:dihydroneopterin triphosphate pyrophosphatase [Thermoplasmatales archaeon]